MQCDRCKGRLVGARKSYQFLLNVSRKISKRRRIPIWVPKEEQEFTSLTRRKKFISENEESVHKACNGIVYWKNYKWVFMAKAEAMRRNLVGNEVVEIGLSQIMETLYFVLTHFLYPTLDSHESILTRGRGGSDIYFKRLLYNHDYDIEGKKEKKHIERKTKGKLPKN